MSESKPRCPLCGREMSLVSEREHYAAYRCMEHGILYVCRHCGYTTRTPRGIAGHVKLHLRHAGGQATPDIAREQATSPDIERDQAISQGDIKRNHVISNDIARYRVISRGDIKRNQPISPDIRRNQEVSGETARRRGELGAGETSQEEVRRVAELAERAARGEEVSLEELASLDPAQLSLLNSLLLSRLLALLRRASLAGEQPKPSGASEQPSAPAELPSFARDNPWLRVLAERGRGR